MSRLLTAMTISQRVRIRLWCSTFQVEEVLSECSALSYHQAFCCMGAEEEYRASMLTLATFQDCQPELGDRCGDVQVSANRSENGS
ncbi:hypothetical protein KC331_g22 [Hortaea werneckii]|nr:hypothetical protein KC331_g22 [Hortaea werneckii]